MSALPRKRWHGTLRLCGAVALLWCCGLAAVEPTARAAQEYSEAAVKAAFLWRFTQYVEWPGRAPAGSAFNIAVLGAPEVERELERFLPGHSVKGEPATVRRVRDVHELGDARMLYIGPRRDAAAVIAALPPRAILVVTDDPNEGLEAGGTVNFIVVDRRVRFEISLAAAERVGLRVSSELLAVAERVQGVPRRTDSGCRGPSGLGDPGLRCQTVVARQ